ncbi:hypothetical protein ACFO5R_02585 [Halosolutus amylolyticus]|uniref:DUF8168 domain-containing protein n=1 Tax=Halosolutus amylolyticus TaxID=2932267 RepID=A0ABD5PJT0_9EURY|nr:hypothetical protein [Halosolutus amylolyticus]
MSDSGGSSSAGVDDVVGEVEPMVATYRHDVHKARSRSHEHAEDVFRGVRVNEDVPLGADHDAALLSRPRGKPERTLDAHESWFRVSLLTGEVVSTSGTVDDVDVALREVIESDDAGALHEAWLSSDVPAMFNESPYYPYTSLKFHTLLVAALLDNYRAGFGFDELFLAVSLRDAVPEVVPHRTVLSTAGFALYVTGDPAGRPAARLGSRPARSFADVWSRLPEFPFDVDASRRWRVLDAQLRRIRSWSVALQFIEEYVAALGPAVEDAEVVA